MVVTDRAGRCVWASSQSSNGRLPWRRDAQHVVRASVERTAPDRGDGRAAAVAIPQRGARQECAVDRAVARLGARVIPHDAADVARPHVRAVETLRAADRPGIGVLRERAGMQILPSVGGAREADDLRGAVQVQRAHALLRRRRRARRATRAAARRRTGSRRARRRPPARAPERAQARQGTHASRSIGSYRDLRARARGSFARAGYTPGNTTVSNVPVGSLNGMMPLARCTCAPSDESVSSSRS